MTFMSRYLYILEVTPHGNSAISWVPRSKLSPRFILVIGKEAGVLAQKLKLNLFKINDLVHVRKSGRLTLSAEDDFSHPEDEVEE